MNGSGSNNKITYHQQVSYCGKPRCRRCREGIGHGPYWYSYQTKEGRTTRTYIGKQLSAEAQATMAGLYPVQSLPVPASSDQEQLRIYTLGQFRLERRNSQNPNEWETVTDAAWQQQRVRALLSCLASTATRKLGREQLLDIVWPDLDGDNASGRLDRAVHSLRHVFEPTRSKPATSPFLLTEREMLALADQQHIWIDADAFEYSIAKGRACADLIEREKILEEASTLYGGNFLPESKVEVTLGRRESLVRAQIGLLIELAELRIQRDALVGAIEPLNQLLSLNTSNEVAVQLLMRVLAQLGRRSEAIRVYKNLEKALKGEFQLVPLAATRALYNDVRSLKPNTVKQGEKEGEGANQGVLDQARTLARAGGYEPDLSRPAPQIGRTHQLPLVGRDVEMKNLQALLGATEQAAKFKLPGQRKHASSLALDTQRTPQCMLLMGEVGIGKTRLAEEIGREARKRGWLVAWSRVYSQESGIPYRLWIEVLRKALTNGMVQRQEISKRPLVYYPLHMLLPELHNLLPQQVEYPAQMSAEQEQLRLWEAARELLANVAEGTPLLIVLDDLQWSDGSSCELLGYLARRIYGHPIIIVGTCRDNELPANHALRPLLTDLQRERVVETVSLEPLSHEQIGTLVTQLAQPTLTLPEPIVERIQERAGGNPFFAEELTRGVDIQGGGGGTGDAVLSLVLPESITAVLDLRLARLSAGCQSLLRKAAVLGGSFEFPLIQAMESATTSEADEDAILDLLEEALKAGMLTEEGVGTRITYLFWHPLLVSHLYKSLSAARCASLHRRAADILRQTYAYREEEGAAIITHHLVRGGGDPQQIIYYAELAGDRAYGLSAYPEAEKHYRIAVEYIESSSHRPTDAEEPLHIAYLLEMLGECTFIQGKTEDARRFYERVLALRDKNRVSVEADAVRHDAQVEALLWCEIGWTWYGVGDNIQTYQCSEKAEQILLRHDIGAGPAWAKIRFQQSYVRWQEGRYEDGFNKAQEALKLLEEALGKQKLKKDETSHLTKIGRSLIGDPVDLGRTHAVLGLLASITGQSTVAVTHYRTGLALYEQYQRRRDIANISCNLADFYLKKADYTSAQSTLRNSLSMAEQIGDVPLMSVVHGNLGLLAMRLGELVEAENQLRQGIELAERINDPVYGSVFYASLSTLLQEQGKNVAAKECVIRSLRTSRSLHITPCIGFALLALGSLYLIQAMIAEDNEKRSHLLHRARTMLQRCITLDEIEAETKTEGKLLLAQVALLTGELEEAQRQAEQTLQEAKQYELTWLVARTQRLLGSIAAARHEDESARQYFEAALRTFQKRGMYLEEARTLRERGAALLAHVGLSPDARQKALQDLDAALHMFSERGAELDRQITEGVMGRA